MFRRPPRRPRKPPPSPDARARSDRERQRRCRARSRAGEKRYVVVARENWVIESMRLSGRMTEEDVSDHALVEEALSRVVIEWMVRWLK